jgi:tellurite resistance protein TerC
MSSSLSHWMANDSEWIGFHLALLVLLAFELLYSRWGLTALAPEARAQRQHRNAIAATIMWVAAALGFAVYVFRTMGSPSATQFLAGYAIEESLSIDNLFVFLLLFRVFRIPPAFQPRVLFWGVLGAILMRGAFIAAGLGLLARFHWISYLFAVILLVASVRLVMPEEDETSDKPPRWIAWISRIHPVSLRSDIFFTVENGQRMATMLMLALIAIETADIIFALDSIPAVLSITRHPFIAYTSNILAVMGLRSLFFLLAHMLKQLRFLHYGLAAVLAFAALKMLTATLYDVGPLLSLGVIVGILAITIIISVSYKKPAIHV